MCTKEEQSKESTFGRVEEEEGKDGSKNSTRCRQRDDTVPRSVKRMKEERVERSNANEGKS